VDDVAYELFERLESKHWWLRGRRAVYFGLLDELLPHNGQISSLDVGCGYGAMIPELERYGPASGIDLFPEAVEHCRRRGFGRVQEGSAYELPARGESFGLVSFFDCLEHLDDDLAALREAHRVLRPGGFVVISAPAYRLLYANNDRVAHHRRRYTRAEIGSRLEQAGFDVRKSTYVNTLLFPLILPLVLIKKLRERLLPIEGDVTTNLTHRVPQTVNEVLYRVFASELPLLKRATFPFGHSIFAVGVKPPTSEFARPSARASANPSSLQRPRAG